MLRRIDGHALLASSNVLKLADIDKNKKIEGGKIIIKNNKMTGILIDNAMNMVDSILPEKSKKDIVNALLSAQKKCFSVGLTTVDDAGLNKKEIEIIDSLQKSHKLLIKIYAMINATDENMNYFLKKGPFQNENLTVKSFKFYADGALGSRGAALLEPYSDINDDNFYGLLIHNKNYFLTQAKKVYYSGFQMNTHAIGDSANRMILDVYAQILKNTNDKRWRIEHAQIVNPADISKFAKYNIIPSVQPTHATSDMYWAESRLGKKRIKNAYQYKTLLQQNGLLAIGTDFPVEDINPIKSFYAAVFRKDSKGFPKHGFLKEQSLSRKEALMGMTIWAAISNFEEKLKGSLEPGKAADFVILDKDIMQVDEKDILNTKVIKTYINGKKVFEN